MDARQHRGELLAAKGWASIDGGSWRVRSQSDPARRYRVNPHSDSCTCPDHEETNLRCKHVWAVLVTMTAETNGGVVTRTTQTTTYSQEWSSYNKAQTEEKDTFMQLLANLCASIQEPPQVKGRPRLPLSDMTFATTYKVFSRFSSRRFASDLREAHRRGFITRVPHFNSVSNYMASPTLTPILQNLVTESSLPLSGMESDFAVDASGFSTSRFRKWLDEKHGIAQSGSYREWVKAHVVVGTRTNIVTAVEVTDWTRGDSPMFDPLVRATAKEFDVVEVSADRAYLTKSNVALTDELGVVPFIPFKSNTRPVLHENTPWARMYHRFMSDPDTFMSHYHKRSNVESTFASIKAKFGDGLMSRSQTGQTNEVLCKLLAHNIVVVGQAAIEFGIAPEFCTKSREAAQKITA
ncbi:MAG: transposase [Actinomycetota bacterium]